MEDKEVGSSSDLVMLLVLNHRTRNNIHRTIQLCGGLLVLCVVLVCVLTLVTHTPSHNSTQRSIPSSPRESVLLERIKSESVLLERIKDPYRTVLDDVFISVKTTSKFHFSRVPVILKTWFTLAPKHTFFFTDSDDDELRRVVGSQLVPTPCPSDHSRQALSCKMQHEFNYFLHTNKTWFCHFDDDQYVNVPGLVRKLGEFPADLYWYLGKPSIQTPLEILDRDSKLQQKKIKFWFGTGGAGFCLSRPLAEKMWSLAGRERFIDTADRMRLPDDVTMGYIVEMLADVQLTKLEEFHSHLEPLRLVGNLENQISFSYSSYGEERNIVDVLGFSEDEDPTRFLSIHCYLFPTTSWCPRT